MFSCIEKDESKAKELLFGLCIKLKKCGNNSFRTVRREFFCVVRNEGLDKKYICFLARWYGDSSGAVGEGLGVERREGGADLLFTFRIVLGGAKVGVGSVGFAFRDRGERVRAL